MLKLLGILHGVARFDAINTDCDVRESFSGRGILIWLGLGKQDS